MTRRQLWTGLIATLAAVVIFMVPFVFIATMAVKDKAQASRLDFTWPQQFLFWQNLTEVLSTRNYQLLLAYFNSSIITVGAVSMLILFGAMVGYVLQRRHSKWNKVIYGCVLAGLIISPAVVPTIWVMHGLFMFKTIWAWF